MDEWKIHYLDEADIQDWLDNLNEPALEKIAIIMDLLKKCGNTLKLPHSKALGDRLFELREKSFGLRIYYTYQRSKIILLVAAGKKDTQERDIKLARRRIKALLRGQ